MHILAASLLTTHLLLSRVAAVVLRRKAVIIGIDGAGGKYVGAIVADNKTYTASAFRDLVQDGALTLFDGTPTELPTISGPGWSSLLTGVRVAKHGVTGNSFTNRNFEQYPDLFAYMPGQDSTSVVNWDQINTYIARHATAAVNLDDDADVFAAAVKTVAEDDFDAYFFAFDDVDHAGHSISSSVPWSTYIAALRKTEEYVGKIVAAVRARPTYKSEEWLVVLCSDHGHRENQGGHGGSSFDERNGLQMMLGPGIPAGPLAPILTRAAPSAQVLLLTKDDYAQIPQAPVLQFDGAESFTVEVSVRLRGAFTDDPVLVSNKDWAVGTNAGWGLFCTGGSIWKVNIGDGTKRSDIEGLSVDDGEWHHIAMVVDRTTQVMSLYQNGEVVDDVSIAAVGSLITNYSIAVGQDGTLTYKEQHPTGLEISDLRIWGGAVSVQSLRKYACLLSLDGHPNSLIGRWDFTGSNGGLSSIAASLSTGASYAQPGKSRTCGLGPSTAQSADVAATVLCHMRDIAAPDACWDMDGTCRQVSAATTTAAVRKYCGKLTYDAPQLFASYLPIAQKKECDDTGEVRLADAPTLQGCADLCKTQSGCSVFIYGRADAARKNRCYFEKTAAAGQCQNTVSNEDYDMYALTGKPYKKVFDGECYGGTESKMYEGAVDNPAIGYAALAAACGQACLDRKTPLNLPSTWTGFDLKGFTVKPSGRCYCEDNNSTTCTRSQNNGYDRYDFAPDSNDASFTKAFHGECTGGIELRMFEGSDNVAITTASPAAVVAACAKACVDQSTSLNNVPWSGFDLKGFIIKSDGRCFCEDNDSATCSKSVDTAADAYDRYDFVDVTTTPPTTTTTPAPTTTTPAPTTTTTTTATTVTPPTTPTTTTTATVTATATPTITTPTVTTTTPTPTSSTAAAATTTPTVDKFVSGVKSIGVFSVVMFVAMTMA